uniref:Uncharacterized protein n=1 Tax=Megaselia scalaris TaxID=36166 RepID=T1GR66_MEGSC
MFRRGESVKFLLDDTIIQYIEKWGLYNSTNTTCHPQNIIDQNEKNNFYLVLNRSSESMDESDNSSMQPTPSPSVKVNLIKDTIVSVINRSNPNVFCCAPSEEKKKKSPGIAVQLAIEEIATKKFKRNE